MYRVRQQIGCSDSYQIGGGENITIAVLDTGAVKHPDFANRILAFKDFIKGKSNCYDDSGHGTHVCGIACGNGYLSEGRYKGIAPKAGLILGKVLDEKGDGIVESMLDGIDWVIENREKYNTRILNISVGIGGKMDEQKEILLRDKLEEAWNEGILVVCAAGNNGPECETLSKVGRSKSLITVGCHDGEYFKDKKNRCASYSARGGTFDTFRKPDLVAPGTNIISCSNTSKSGYIHKSGTSMATPIVSGALALLLQKYPDFDKETAKRKLLYSAVDLKEPWYQQGWGMINITNMMDS